MAFTRNPNYLWNDKPLPNCTHDELVEAVTTLLKKVDRLSDRLYRAESSARIIDFDDDFGL